MSEKNTRIEDGNVAAEQASAGPGSGGGELVPANRAALEVSQFMAQSQRRHDLEMRMAVLAVEYDRALGSVQALVRRYDQLQEEWQAAQPPLPGQKLVPSLLRTALKLARQQVRAQYPDLRTLMGGK